MILKNLLFPPKCIVCGKVLPVFQKLPNLCAACEKELPHLPVRLCPKCGKPADAGYDKPFCLYCSKKLTGVEAVVSPFSYNKQIRQSILKFKFGSKPYYAKSYAQFMYNRLCDYHLEKVFSAIVPAPISRKRLRQRGYNQALLIAKALSKKTGIPVQNVLCKIRNTPPQSTLNYQERLHNLKDAIELKKSAKNLPESVLFIDDVYTTGTTVKTCADILRKNGCKRIYAATTAMHLPEPDLELEELDL